MSTSKSFGNSIMWFNRRRRSGPGMMADRAGKTPRAFRTAALVMLAVSPFLAYVLLLPEDTVAPVPLDPDAGASASPSPSFSPSPFVAFPVPDPNAEAAPLDAAAEPSPQPATARPRARIATRPSAAPPPPPPPPPANDPPPDDSNTNQQDPPEEAEPPPDDGSGDPNDCWPLCNDPGARGEEPEESPTEETEE